MVNTMISRAMRPKRGRLLYVLVSVAGLVPAFCLSGLCAAYLYRELRFDPFVSEPSAVHAIFGSIASTDGTSASTQNVPILLKSEIESKFGEAVSVSRECREAVVVRVPSGAYEAEMSAAFVDPAYFAVVTHSLQTGARPPDIGAPEVFLRADVAARVFPNGAAVGQFLTVSGQPAVVGGVLSPLPSNTRFDSEIILSTAHPASPTRWLEKSPRWTDFVCPLWVRLVATSPRELGVWLDDLVRERYAKEREAGELFEFSVINIRDLHLATHVAQMSTPTGVASLQLFAAATLATLAVALANYFGLTAARIVKRTREVGIRRALGATDSDVLKVLLSEPVGTAVLAAALSCLLLADVARILEHKSSLTLLESHDNVGVALAAMFLVLVACATTALMASRWTVKVPLPAALRAPQAGRRFSYVAPNALLVFQLAASLLSVSITFVAANQAHFAMNRGLGDVDVGATIVISGVRSLGGAQERQRFVKRLNTLSPGIVAAGSSMAPGDTVSSTVTVSRVWLDGSHVSLSIVRADPGFFALYGKAPLAGRLYDGTPGAGGTGAAPRAVIADESAVRALGFSSAEQVIGKVFGGPKEDIWAEIVGVVKDMEMYSVRQQQMPTFFYVNPGWTRYVTVKISEPDVLDAIADIERTWSSMAYGFRFSFSFLDERMRRVSQSLIFEAYVIGLLGTVTSLLSCIGLVALVTFQSIGSAREIAVRKVFGASSLDIACAMYLKTGKLLLGSIPIALPLAYFGADFWLAGFTENVGLTIWPFLTATTLLTALATLSVLPIIFHYSRTKPVTHLRQPE